MNLPKTLAGEQVLRFSLNALFQKGRWPYGHPRWSYDDIMPPPRDECWDGDRFPRRNLIWRWMAAAATELTDLSLPGGRLGNGEVLSWRYILYNWCASKPVDWINGYVWGYDPRPKVPQESREMPFITWPKQVELANTQVRCLLKGEDHVIVKSRDVGVTILIGSLTCWAWNFLDYEFLIVTKDEELLDDGTNMSYFGKLTNLILKRLPMWMLPARWSFESRRQFSITGKLRKPMLIGDSWQPKGAAILGKAAGRNVGTGCRAAALVVDESDVIDDEHPGLVGQMCGNAEDTVGGLTTMSSPRGEATYNAKKRPSDGRYGRVVHKSVLKWYDDPRKSTIETAPGKLEGAYPLFCMLYRPRGWSPHPTQEQWQELIDLHVGGERWLELTNEERKAHTRLVRRMQRLDPKLDAREICKPLSMWYLQECYSRSGKPGGAESIHTEIDAEPRTRSRYLFSPDVLDAMPCLPTRVGYIEPIAYDLRCPNGDPIEKDWRMTDLDDSRGGPLLVWKLPEEGHYYVLTEDVSPGVGRDFAVIDVWDATVEPFEQVAQWRDDRTAKHIQARWVYRLHQLYNNAFVCCETNDDSVMETLLLVLGFPANKCYHAKENPDPDNARDHGYYSAGQKRAQGMTGLANCLEERPCPIIYRSAPTVDELGVIRNLTQVESGQGQPAYPAEQGNDDCAVSAMLLKVAVENLQERQFGRPVFAPLGAQMERRKQQSQERAEQLRRMRQKYEMERDPHGGIFVRSKRQVELVG